MLLRMFYDESLAQASYLLGCQHTGEALVIDPARDITPYLKLAAAEGLRIAQVAETHIHADYVSGARELAEATGAALYLSAEGGHEWQYAFSGPETVLLRDGDAWMLGRVRLRAVHTSGHTPEHLMFEFTDTVAADQPMGLVTGDTLFAGDVGRPDLLEEAAGMTGTSEPGARDQFRSVQRLKAMPDYLLALPGHGAGSACGKALGAVPATTLGYEKRVNPAFQFTEEQAFARWLLSDQPEAPAYFARMKRMNKAGPALLRDLPEPQMLEGFVLGELAAAGSLMLDARPFVGDLSVVPGAILVPPTSSFATYAGWVVPDGTPVTLIGDRDALPDLLRQLRAVGVEEVTGFVTTEAADDHAIALPLATPEEAERALARGEWQALDVRARSEFNDGHIPGALHRHYGQLAAHLDELPQDRPLLVACASGKRSAIAMSILRRAGFDHLIALRGGFDAWRAAGLAEER